MKDIGAGFGRHFCGHWRFGNFLEAELTAETLLVKGEGFTAVAVEVEIGDDLCVHGFFSQSYRVPAGARMCNTVNQRGCLRQQMGLSLMAEKCTYESYRHSSP